MEIPTITIGSKAEIVQVEDSKPEKPNGENIEESSKPKELNENAQDSSNSQELNELAEVNRSPLQDAPAEEEKPQGPNKQAEDSKSEGPEGHVEEAKPEELGESAGETSEILELDEVSEDLRLHDPGQQAGESTLQGLNEQPEDSKPQDLKDWAEEQMKMLEEQHPDEESVLSSVPDSEYVSMAEWQNERLSSSSPESRIDDHSSVLEAQTEDSKPQDLKEKTEEQVDTSQNKSEKEPSLYSDTTSWKKPTKKQKDEASNTEQRNNLYTRPVNIRNRAPGRPPLQGFLSQQFKPKTADKAIQCNKLLMRRLPLPGTQPPQRSIIPRVSPPAACENKATQISQSFERLRKRPPPLVLKKKNEDKAIVQVSPSKTSPPNLYSGNGHMSNGNGSMRQSGGGMHKRSGILNKGISSHPPKRVAASTVAWASSPTVKKGKSKGPNVVYNIYFNVCDGWKGIDREHHIGTSWEGVEWVGLSRACIVFSSLKSGKIHVSNLHPILDVLGVLVTSEEMYHALNFVNVNESGNLDFTEFLEVVNKTSPFAETDALQNTLRAFRKINNGMVNVYDLSSVLRDLEVHLSTEEIQTTLGHTRLSKNKTIDLSEFMLAARNLQRSLEKEEEVLQDEYTTMGKRPFQDVTELVSAESRWRRKYQSYLDEEMATSTSLSPWLALMDVHDDICPAHSRKPVCGKGDLKNSNTASTILNEEGEDKENTIPGGTKSESDINVQRSHSLTSPLRSKQGEEEDHDITEVSKSQSEVIGHTDPSPLPSVPSAEGKRKSHDSVEALESQSDLRLSKENRPPPEDTSIAT
nr:uncharacterized protein LOC110081359 isoform X1 [Pogona vitticeps]